MHEELEELRREVEELKRQKEAETKRRKQEEREAQEAKEMEIEEVEAKAKEIISSIEEGKSDAKEVFDELLKTIKKDYENLSPTSAILLFALGAAFGHALSSK
jgi:SMC interacting uncharacterized protein involved in chromosome segregation